MTDIKLPDLKNYEKEKYFVLKRKMERSPKVSEMYIRICHKSKKGQTKITGPEMSKEMNIQRGNAFQLIENFVNAEMLKRHKVENIIYYLIDSDFIDEDLVKTAMEQLEKLRGKKL